MAERNRGAIDKDEFKLLMSAVMPPPLPPRVAVAVSGGSDSTALCILLGEWAHTYGINSDVLIIDHQLRPESSKEAQLVSQRLEGHGFNTHILNWSDKKPQSGVQAAARKARYQLLFEWCDRHKVRHLFLGHHIGDQAETFLMRLGHKTGLDGLSAMSLAREIGGIRLLRPLLSIPKMRLVETLKTRGQPWIDDPSNFDLRYERSRVRTLSAPLAKHGITEERIAVTARRLSRAREALEYYVAQFTKSHVTVDPFGFCWLEKDKLVEVPTEVALRVLYQIIWFVGASSNPPRLETLERLWLSAIDRAQSPSFTLSGCQILVHREKLLICRERRGLGKSIPIAQGSWQRWDKRFDIFVINASSFCPPNKHVISSLGRKGLNLIMKKRRMNKRLGALDLPHAVWVSLPALWDNEQPVHVPHLNYCCNRGDKRLLAEYSPNMSLFSSRFSVVSAETSPI